MILQSFYITIIFLLLFSTQSDASRNRTARQNPTYQCANLVADPCSYVQCSNDAQCKTDLTTDDCFKCQCTLGYTGKLCDTFIPILPTGCSPGCQNGGVCNVNTCSCPTGFIGTLCETRNYCLPNNPCMNGGRCLSTAGSFACDCTSTGYLGSLCTEPIATNPCLTSPCQNGGQCTWNGVEMKCVCAGGYIGAYCQVALPCGSTPCQNGGKCELAADNSYRCVCPALYTGERCEKWLGENHPCLQPAGSVCLNGGTCTVNGVGYLCNCKAGWSGTNCGTIVDGSACSSNPCSIHSTCMQAVQPSGPFAYCICDNGWTGRYCDVSMNGECPVGYCLSGGVCALNGNVPYCVCPAQYTGERCQTLIPTVTTTITTITTITTTTTTAIPQTVTPCFPNPCQNGGACVQDNNFFFCKCLPNWTGRMCDVLVDTTTTTTTTAPSPGSLLCAQNPCKNGGTCLESSNVLFCKCLPNWTGRMCDVALDIFTTTTTTTSPGSSVCAPNPCQNGGTCYRSGNVFVCACVPNWGGLRCETLQTILTTSTSIPPTGITCANQPCRNGGVCYSTPNSYHCYCAPNNGYTGKNCETIVTPQPSNCPLNCTPGTCILSGSTITPYVCRCAGGVLSLTNCTLK